MTNETEIRLIHLADLHLGFQGNIASREDELDPGRPLREIDLREAVKTLVRRIIQANSPNVDLVVIAGDLFHYSSPGPRAVEMAARLVSNLIKAGIEVVIIDGNHETTGNLKTGSPTAYLKVLGAHVINGQEAEVIYDKKWNNPKLKQSLALTALPYLAVARQDFTGLNPLGGYQNVLVTHGSVHGMDELNTLRERTYHLPADLLRRGWNYVAIGDWHMHAYQPLEGVPAYYSGSLEAINFGEATHYPPRPEDKYATRGGLDIRLTWGQAAQLTSLTHNPRPVLKLNPVDATDLTADALLAEIQNRFDSNLPPDSLIRLEIRQCTIPIYSQLDRRVLDELRQRVRYCDLSFVDWARPLTEQTEQTLMLASPTQQWTTHVEQTNTDPENQKWYIEKGAELIKEAQILLQKDRAASEI